MQRLMCLWGTLKAHTNPLNLGLWDGGRALQPAGCGLWADRPLGYTQKGALRLWAPWLRMWDEVPSLPGCPAHHRSHQ